MEKEKLRPEWIPSAYSAMGKVEKEDKVEKQELKPVLQNNKTVAKRSFQRKVK
jgi:hypothetical protein